MTTSIRITVKTRFLEEESDPRSDRFVYAYTIDIENVGDEFTQLISRKWRIVDAFDHVQVVEGEGVVGKKPKLGPGDKFSYTSGVVLPTPQGTMSGEYTMCLEDGRKFPAPIPTFALVQRKALH